MNVNSTLLARLLLPNSVACAIPIKFCKKKKIINQTKNKLHWENEEKMEPLAVITEQLTSFSHPNPKTVEGNIMVFRRKTFHAYKGSKKCNPHKSRNGESYNLWFVFNRSN